MWSVPEAIGNGTGLSYVILDHQHWIFSSAVSMMMDMPSVLNKAANSHDPF